MTGEQNVCGHAGLKIKRLLMNSVKAEKNCSVCGKPCGPAAGLEDAEVSHFACAYESAKEPRERLWKLSKNSNHIDSESVSS